MASNVANSDSLKAYKEQALKEFDQAHSTLTKKRHEVTERYIKPASEFVVKEAQARPITTVLLAIFLATSFIPLLTFLGFALGTLIVVGGGSLAFALFWATVLIGGALFALVGTLAVTGFISLCGLFWVGVAYTSFRFAANIAGGKTIEEGLHHFIHEARTLLLGAHVRVHGEKKVGQHGQSASVGLKVESTDDDKKVGGSPVQS